MAHHRLWGTICQGTLSRMNVCLDFQPAVVQQAGIGRYTRMLAKYLLETAQVEDKLKIFCLDFRRRLDPGALRTADWNVWRFLPGTVVQNLWRIAGFPPFDWLSGRADVFHFTNFIRPPLRHGKSVVTVFDMSFERFPECAEDRNLSYLRSGIRRTVERSDAILTISDFSAREIEALIPEALGKTHAVPLGIDPAFRRPPDHKINEVRKTLGIERPYLLTVGTLEPRKNLSFLVDVFERMDAPDLDLVIAGMPGWKYEGILERFADSVRAERIHYVRHVPDSALAALYAGAELMIVPSLYEGFGFPPLEAMACGTPVVSSAGGSLPEVLGEAALVLPGFEVDQWKYAIEELLHDRSRRDVLIHAGHAQAARYRWETTARQTWDVYRSVLS